MNKRILFLGVLLTVLCSGLAVAQTGTVRGRVTDKKTGEALSGVRITLTDTEGSLESLLGDGPKLGTISAKDGSFEIKNVKPSKYIAQTSFVSYKQASVNLTVDGGGTATINLGLVPDIKGLDEVIVTGVASRTQKGVAEVAVGRVDAAALTENQVYTDVGQMLMGKISGITITPASGNVGGGLRVNVRSGAGLIGGQPVYFVDGVRISAGNLTGYGAGGQQVSFLSTLNPDDIEDIQVLKGPAASALYGTSGQNGVVLITTKRGKNRGGKSDDLTLTAQTIIGWNEQAQLYTAPMALSYQDANAAFKRGRILQYSVNASGSSGIFNYFAGYEDRSEEGILPQNEFRRRSARLNLEAVTSKNFTLSGSANFVNTFTTRPQNDNNIYGWIRNTLSFGPDTAGNSRSYARFNGTDSLLIASIENSVLTNRFTGSLEAKYIAPFLPGLSARGLVGFDFTNLRNLQQYPAQFVYPTVPRGSRSLYEETRQRINFDLNLTYNTEITEGLHSVTILGAQLFDTRLRSVELTGQNFPTEVITDITSGDATLATVDEDFENFRDGGVFLRQELNYQQTYFLSAGVRNDYASTLNANATSIFYPQASAAIRLDKLRLLPEEFNMLKLRVAYGETGRLPTFTQSQAFLWTIGRSPLGAGAILNNAGNPGIRPERIQELEFGLEFEYDNAFGVEATYYFQDARDAILNAPRPPSRGIGSNPVNIGSIRGWGFESLVYATPIRTSDFQLNLNLVFNYAENRAVNIGDSQFITDGFNRNFLIPGYIRSNFMERGTVIRPTYIDPATFNTTNRQLASTGVYNWSAALNPIQFGGASGPAVDTSLVSLGPSAPLYTGAFTVDIRFLRDFTVIAMAEYGWGGFVYNGGRQFMTDGRGNNPRFNDLAWQLQITGTQFPVGNSRRQVYAQIPSVNYVTPGTQILTPGTPEYARAAEEFARLDPRLGRGQLQNYLESSDFVRMRELSVRWNAKNLWNELFPALPIKDLSFTLAGRNLFLLTRARFLTEIELNTNPSTATTAGSLSQGQDFRTLQQPRTFNFTVSLGF